MADKNFARSGTADTDLLADDDPLSELARLVGYEAPPVQRVDGSFTETVQTASRRENPVLALEDELMRAFEQYDAPSRVVPEPVFVEPVAEEETIPRHVEPVFEMPEPAAEDPSALLDAVPTRDDAAGEPELAADPALFLADELEAAVLDVPSVKAEPAVHAGRAFVDRLEPRFEAPVRDEPAADFDASGHSDAGGRAISFFGLLPTDADENPLADAGLDLERELELSIGDGFADDLIADAHRPDVEASFVEPLPVAVEAVDINAEPNFDGWLPDEPAPQDAEPFRAEPVYAGDEPHFVAEMPFETREDRARAVAEAETQWQAGLEEPVFEPEPVYQVESVEKGQNYDHDALLAEVERYPVPESRAVLPGAAIAAVATASMANITSIFGRATPFANREPVDETARKSPVDPVREPVFEPVQAPAAEIRQEPVVTPVIAPTPEPEVDFDAIEFDLSDIELDLSDFVLDDEPVKQDVKAEAEKPVEAETPVRREPATAVPVSAYTTPQTAAVEANDGVLPFDPSMIADTDEGVSPVGELDVPQLPLIEKEKPPVLQPDYEFDIDAEMAQLFTEPAAKATRDDSLQSGVAAGAVAVAISQPAGQINEVDDFERALEEDFRRSLNQPERMAIPVDPGQARTLYSGDGYADEQARPRRGLLIAASIAGLLLVGSGGVYAWTAFSGGTAGSGEPRVILADKEPVKVVPEEKGGKTVPNQDKAVYDRVAGDTASTPQQEQLVTSTEEPVDVVQRTLTPETLPFDGPEDGVEAVIAADDENRLLPGVDEPETATAEAGSKPLVSPRKVKTMIVKPDGTLVAREEAVTEPVVETAQIDAKATATTGAASGEAVATANAVIDADTPLSTEQAATDGQPRSALAEVASAEVEDTAPVRTVKTTTIGGTAADANMPVPETRPIDQPVNVVGTVTENGNVSGTQTAEATPTATPTAEATPTATETQQAAEQTQVAAVAPGSYVVQIASLPSEAEAQKSFNALSSKFSGVIGGRGVDIKKAEIPNKGTFFRVRIPAGSREEANALCARYKNAGGSCLVTR